MTGAARAASPGRHLRHLAREALAHAGSEKGGAGVIVKDILLVLHWAGWYAGALLLGEAEAVAGVLAAVPLALSLVSVMFGVMHDGSHRAISERNLWNRLGSWTLVLSGGSAIGWRQEHVVRHHGQTNVMDEDPDLDTGGLLRFHASQPWRRIHRWQALYAPLLYGLVALRWIWYEDFDDLLRNPYGMAPRARLRHGAEILCAKVSHAGFLLILPAWLWGGWAMLAFYGLHMGVVGLVMSLVFVVAHVGEDQEVYADRDGRPRDWSHSQLATTADFAAHSRFLRWALGGLNFQVEHHLFPQVSPRHYPRLRPVVQRWARQEGLTYHEYPTTRVALAAHFRHLSRLGAAP